MRGIPSNLCTHHIYIKSDSHLVCQPQWRVNPNIRDIVKEEIQKLLEAGFIYPISDSEWLSPLVIVPKKNGKWRFCVDYCYREKFLWLGVPQQIALNPELNLSQYAIEIKCLTLKDQTSYLILDGWSRSPLSFPIFSLNWYNTPSTTSKQYKHIYIMVLDLF